MSEILVSAAASLTEAFQDIGRAFTRENPSTRVRFNFASSGALLQQIRQGAPVDVFASAAAREMDALARAGRIETSTRIVFAGNRLALIAPAGISLRGSPLRGSPLRGSPLRGWADLATPAIRRVGLSNPDSVPSGRYARETLQKRGLWSAVRPKAVLGENVRQTLTYVAGGDVDAGIVFATDARIEGRRVRIVATAAPGRDHATIVYPAAVVRGAPNPAAARRFVRFLLGAAARGILARHGFLSARKG